MVFSTVRTHTGKPLRVSVLDQLGGSTQGTARSNET